MLTNAKQRLVQQLQADILAMQGSRPASVGDVRVAGLEAIEQAFPNATFPLGALHEFVCAGPEQSAACRGFIAGLLASLMNEHSLCLWVSVSGQHFVSALAQFGLQPDHIVFVDAGSDKELLWVTEEGLKCTGITAVVTEINSLNLAQARRLQLAAEQNQVTCLMLRNCAESNRTSICAARWQIRPVASKRIHHIPGVGLPRWEVELLKVRNGTPGKWLVEWSKRQFRVIGDEQDNVRQLNRKAG